MESKTTVRLKQKLLRVQKEAFAERLNLVAATLAVLFLVYATFGSGPAILQDELVYSLQSQASLPQQVLFGNFLHSTLYSVVETCGTGFYTCVKTINLGFLLVFVFGFYMLTRELLATRFARGLLLPVILAPGSLFVAFFMPEIMGAAFLIWSLVFGVLASRKQGVSQFYFIVASGAVLGIGALAKFHLLLFMPGLIALWFAVGSGSKSARLVLAGIVSTLSFRILAGLSLAGAEGMRILPRGYFSFGDPSPILGNEILYLFEQTAGYSGTFNAVDMFLGVLAQHTFISSGLLLLTFGPIFPLTVSALFFSYKRLTPDEVKQSQVLRGLALVLLNGIAIGVFFAAYISSAGDDHSQRVLFRYWEYLVPVAYAIGFSVVLSPNAYSRRLQTLIVSSFLFVGLVTVASGSLADLSYGWTDSAALLFGAYGHYWIGHLLITAGLLASLALASVRVSTALVVAAISLSSIANLNGFMTFMRDADSKNTAGAAAGYFLLSNPLPKQDSVAVVASTRQSLGTTKLLARDPDIEMVLAPPSAVISTFSSDKNFEWLVLSNEMLVEDTLTDYFPVAQGKDFTIYRQTQEGAAHFGSLGFDRLGIHVKGKVAQTSSEIVSLDRSLIFEFLEPIAPNTDLTITLSLQASVLDRTMILGVGGDEFEVELGPGSDPQELRFTTPEAGSLEVLSLSTSVLDVVDANSEFSHSVGLAVQSISLGR